jgi:hypothetical protein
LISVGNDAKAYTDAFSPLVPIGDTGRCLGRGIASTDPIAPINDTSVFFFLDFAVDSSLSQDYVGGVHTSLSGAAPSTAALSACFTGAAAADFTNVTTLSTPGATYATGSLLGYTFDYNGDQYRVAFEGAAGTAFSVTTTPIAPGGGGAAPANALISSFLQSRANNLASNQPSLLPIVRRSTGRSFSADVSQGAGHLNFASDTTHPVWAYVQGSWSEHGATETNYILGAVGAHTWVAPNVIVGGMVQFDYARDQNGASEVEGTGWMAGPYVAARLANQPLYFEARLLYGQTDNDVSSIGVAADDFDGERWLGQARVTGEIQRQQLTLFPHLDYTYVSEDQDAYTDGSGAPVAGQNIRLSTLTLGLDFSHPLPVQSGHLVLTGGLSGIWSDTSGSGTAAGVISVGDTARGRLDMGIERQFTENNSMTVGAFYDGIGTSDFEGFGLSLLWNTQF